MEMNDLVAIFFEQVELGEIEIYNEFSLQHELGIFLRKYNKMDYKIQFERNTKFFGINQKLVKKEIDIVLYNPHTGKKVAAELKYPNNGRHPESLFDVIKDIKFLEQLVENGFDEGYSILYVKDPLFYSGPKKDGIYSYFRSTDELKGIIQKPTGNLELSYNLDGIYKLSWHKVKGTGKYINTKVT